MTEEFNDQALQYLLGELDVAERATFEARLTRDSHARAALKTCADSLAGFACDTATAEPLTASDQRMALSAILAATTDAPPAAPRAPVIVWSRFIWPVAAALLLALNLLDFRRPLDVPRIAGGRSEQRPLVNVKSEAPAQSHGQNQLTGNNGITTRGAEGSVANEQQQLEKLRSDYANLQRTSSIVRAEYEALMQQLAQRALLEKKLGRLAAMELVDERSYASGKRKGLLDIARGLLTEPGIVALDGSTVAPEHPTLAPSVPDSNPGASSAVATPPVQPEPEPPTDLTGENDPYAWSVFDETEHRGYLNLYNLPEVPSDRSLQLWVRPLDGTTYYRVGEVPSQFYGKNGNLLYTLPANTPTPSEILITQEPKRAIPAAPSGPVVLRGP